MPEVSGTVQKYRKAEKRSYIFFDQTVSDAGITMQITHSSHVGYFERRTAVSADAMHYHYFDDNASNGNLCITIAVAKGETVSVSRYHSAVHCVLCSQKNSRKKAFNV